MFLFTALALAAVLAILRGVRGTNLGRQGQLLVLAGWLAWIEASDCMGELPEVINEQAQTGTLVQLCLVPIPRLNASPKLC